ncbi:hypothetical protein OIU78_025635 [Salix suchowensis]|nr:hypothetical protein OIU78_025635 [Salix suchowensis]
MILSFSNPHLVAAAVAPAAVEVGAAEADVAGTVAAAAAAAVAAASGNEFGAAETVVQLRKYALIDYWDIIAGLLQKMQSSSWVHHLAFDQSVPSDAEFLLSVRHSRAITKQINHHLRPVTKVESA